MSLSSLSSEFGALSNLVSSNFLSIISFPYPFKFSSSSFELKRSSNFTPKILNLSKLLSFSVVSVFAFEIADCLFATKLDILKLVATC